MKNKNLFYMTNMQWLCMTWRRNGFKIIHAKNQINSGDAQTSSKNLTSRRKPKIHFSDNSQEFQKWNHDRSTLDDQKHVESHNELYDEWKKDLRQYRFSLDFGKLGGQKQWSVIAIFEMCKTYLQMARHFMNVGSIHHLMGRSFFFNQGWNSIQDHPKTKVECISAARKSFLRYSWDTL